MAYPSETPRFIEVPHSLTFSSNQLRNQTKSTEPPNMKAGQWDPTLKKVVINDIPIPTPGHNQFLVKIHSASLCHSDLMHTMRPSYFVTLGHEGVGHITSIHASAQNSGFNIGDAIGFNYFLGCCQTCPGCAVHNLWCETGNSKLQGFVVDGFFAEYAVVNWKNAVLLPKELEADIGRAAPLFCAGITAFHSVDSCELKEGEWFAVVGCGGLGQYAIKYAKAMGLKVIGLDISDTQLTAATTAGADHVFNTLITPSWATDIKSLTDNKGVHAAAVYSASNAAYASAPSILRIGGLLMVVGISSQDLQISTFDLTTGRYRVKGESTSIPSRMKKAVEFTARHGIVPEVEFRRIEELPDMVAEMEGGKAEKRQVVVF